MENTVDSLSNCSENRSGVMGSNQNFNPNNNCNQNQKQSHITSGSALFLKGNNGHHNNQHHNPNGQKLMKITANNVTSSKFTCRYDIQIENDKEFQVAKKIIGAKGYNMKQIIDSSLQDTGYDLRTEND